MDLVAGGGGLGMPAQPPPSTHRMVLRLETSTTSISQTQRQTLSVSEYWTQLNGQSTSLAGTAVALALLNRRLTLGIATYTLYWRVKGLYCKCTFLTSRMKFPFRFVKSPAIIQVEDESDV